MYRTQSNMDETAVGFLYPEKYFSPSPG